MSVFQTAKTVLPTRTEECRCECLSGQNGASPVLHARWRFQSKLMIPFLTSALCIQCFDDTLNVKLTRSEMQSDPFVWFLICPIVNSGPYKSWWCLRMTELKQPSVGDALVARFKAFCQRPVTDCIWFRNWRAAHWCTRNSRKLATICTNGTENQLSFIIT